MKATPFEDGIKIGPAIGKVTRLLVICLVLIAASLFIVYNGEPFGFAGVVFFGACFIVIAINAFDKDTGVYVSPRGIKVLRAFKKMDWVAWTSIKRFESHQVKRTEFIGVVLNNPEEFAANMGAVGRWFYRFNMEHFSYSFTISTSSYACGHDELWTFLQECLKKYRAQEP